VPSPLSQPRWSALTILSLLLPLTIAALWLRSYLPDTLLWESDSGRLLVIAQSRVRAVARAARDQHTVESYLRYLLNPRFSPNLPPREHRLLGFYYARGDDEGAPHGHFRVVGVPYWFLFTVVAVPTVLLLRRQHLAGRRRARGLCPACGYDCRATPGRCPECGAAPN
jgi:hypothetical protein